MNRRIANNKGIAKNKPKRAEQQQDVEITIGQEMTLTIRSLGINGEGVGYFKRKAVFVPGALRDEVVICQVTAVHRGYALAKLLKVRKASPDRVQPPCSLYSQCGGCQLQHLAYPAQLREKKDLVIQAFEKYTTLTAAELPIAETIGMENPWQYRNKAQLQVGIKGKQVIAGLYKEGTHQLIDLTECAIQHPKTNEVIRKTKQFVQELGIPVYQERKQTGVLRTIVTRVGIETGELQLVLVTRTEEIPRLAELLNKIRQSMPEVKSIVQNIHPEKTSTIFGEKTKLLWGTERIAEHLGELSFSLSPRAFFQLNPEQTVKLYNTVKEFADLSGQEKVVDAYCGVGTIGLWLAKEAAEVRGMDVIPEAIMDARENARLSGITNTVYEIGKAETLLPKWIKEGFQPDVIIVDPPRTGCDQKLLETIVQVKPTKLIYVSCNPSTLAKDCAVLLERGFRIERIQPVDMFPNTAHVECVALMSRVEK